jgi:outer membrane protein OmpA-like peptidoglycan-associated protein
MEPTGKFRTCVCGPSTTMTDLTPGQAQVIWSAVAPLPAGVATVDVTIAEQVIPNVPVGDGPLLPLAEDQEAPFVRRHGVARARPRARLATARTSQPAAFELTQRVSNLEQSVTTSTGEVSLAADVLFAKNSATLTAKGTKTVADAAAQIKATETGKALTVTGHADSDGSNSYNQSLSEKRAKAVAAALDQGPRRWVHHHGRRQGRDRTDRVEQDHCGQGQEPPSQHHLHRRTVTVAQPPRRPRLTLAILGVVSVVALSSCTGDDPEPSVSPTGSASSSASTTPSTPLSDQSALVLVRSCPRWLAARPETWPARRPPSTWPLSSPRRAAAS